MSKPFNRRAALCEQDLAFGSSKQTFTGLDFVSIADHDRQDELHVFFLVDPTLIELKSLPGTAFATRDDAFPLSHISIAGADDGFESAKVEIESAIWREDERTKRTYLQVGLSAPGDFSTYTIQIRHPVIDTYFERLSFSFKSACPSDLDCEAILKCSEPAIEDVTVDYIARDFDSFRDAVLSFLSQRFPLWREKIEADTGVMLLELFCALADEFAYMQDRLSRENTLLTAREPRSQLNHARLLDYQPDMGRNARGDVALTLKPGTDFNLMTDPGVSQRILTLQADVKSGVKLTFQTLAPFKLDPDTGWDNFWMHSDWNRLPLDTGNAEALCLEAGSTELTLAPLKPDMPGGDYVSPLMGRIDPDGSRLGRSTAAEPYADEEMFWVGRRLILVMDPKDRSRPHKSWQTTITKVRLERDALRSASLGVDYWVTHIEWDRATPLPEDFDKADSFVHLNTIEAMAGEVVEERFRIGHSSDDASTHQIPSVIFRQGPCPTGETERSHFARFGLEKTVRGGLAFDPFGKADIQLLQYEDSDFEVDPIESWRFIESLQEADGNEAFYTVEPGFWTVIQQFERWDGKRVQRFNRGDYASPHGFSLLFGDGQTGRRPEEGTVFSVRYRLNPGDLANIAANTLAHMGDESVNDPELLSMIESVTNPLPFRGGREPETIESVRRNAPQAFRAYPKRAVRDEDFESILGRIEAFQKVGARQRWTGSWLTRFVTADPAGAQSLSEENKTVLFGAANAIRMASRHVAIVDPIYNALTLKVFVCVKEGIYFSDLVEVLQERLSLFFDPDNWTFGQAMIRSEIEAVIQSVDGVRGIDSIWVRQRADRQFERFSTSSLSPKSNEIFVLKNDPSLPHLGSFKVHDHAQFEVFMPELGLERMA